MSFLLDQDQTLFIVDMSLAASLDSNIAPSIISRPIPNSNRNPQSRLARRLVEPLQVPKTIPSSVIGWSAERFEEVPKDVICLLCMQVVREAMTLNCAHTYCQSCILSNELHFKNKCPTCLNSVSQLVPDFAIRMKVNGMTLCCSYKEHGCPTKLALLRISSHEESCSFRPIECKACLKKIPSCHMVSHQSDECPKRIKTCEKCLEKTTYDAIEHHHRLVCRYTPLHCSYCPWNGIRQDLVQHEVECELKPRSCSYASVGCTFIHTPLELKQHLLETDHLPLVHASMDRMTRLFPYPEGPFLTNSHEHMVTLIDGIRETCNECKKPTTDYHPRGLAYQCQFGCDYVLCLSCLHEKRIYDKKRKGVVFPAAFSNKK